MNTPNNFNVPTALVSGGGTAGETAAGLLDAIEAGLIPGIDYLDVNVLVTTSDNGGRSRDIRLKDRLHAPGDIQRSIHGLGGNSYANPLFGDRMGIDATPEDVARVGNDLLIALSYSDTPVTAERGREIIDGAVQMSRELMGSTEKQLLGLTMGHLIVSSLMLEHRRQGGGKNAQTGVDEAAAFMAARGRVILDSLVTHELEMLDGDQHLYGEDVIDYHVIENPDDVEVWVSPTDSQSVITVPINPVAEKAIEEADYIIASQGSLYGSVIEPWLVSGAREKLIEAEADGQQFIIVVGLDKEETTGPTMSGPQYVQELEKYTRRCDKIVVNNNHAPLGDQALLIDRDKIDQIGEERVVYANLLSDTDIERHPNDQVARRSKVRTNMKIAAVAALAEDPKTALALAA